MVGGLCLYVLRATKGRDGWRKGRGIEEVERAQKKKKKTARGVKVRVTARVHGHVRARAAKGVSSVCCLA